jgi:hypothetical protein
MTGQGAATFVFDLKTSPLIVIARHSRSKDGVASLACGDEAIQRAPPGAQGKSGAWLDHRAFPLRASRALDCFAVGGAKRRRSSNGYGSQ